MTFDERLEEIIEIFWVGYENDFTEIHKRFVAGEITIEQQVEESEVVWDRQTKQAISAIKQAIRETFGGKKSITLEDYSQDDLNNLSDSDIGVIINFRQGYNAKANEIEKGFGLDG